MTDFRETGRQLEGYWTPHEIAARLGKNRQVVIDAITGRGGRYPRTLRGSKVGQHWLIADADAEAFIEGHRPNLDQVTQQSPADKVGERLLSGYWTTQELADAIGSSQDKCFHAITGRGGKYPVTLRAIKIGGRWLIADADARAFIGNERAKHPKPTEANPEEKKSPD